MRRSKNWPPITERRYPSGEVGFVVNVGMVNGKRIRPVFRTRGEAEERAKRCRAENAKEGELAFALPVKLRLEAADCVDKLAEYGASLTEATNFYVTHVLEHRKAPIISKMIDDLLQEKEQGRRRGSTIQSLESFLGKIADRFGDRQLHEVTLPELSAICLAPDVAPRTQFNRIRMMSQLYNHALRKKWVSVNLTKDILIPEWDPAEPGILKVEEVQRILRHANQFNLLPFICIGLFAGLRRCELMKLDWIAVKRQDHEIVVDATIAKTRARRVVSYGETLAAWLEMCARDSGPIVDASTFDDCFTRLRTAAGINDWPHNALRHSFASYHLAAFRDPVQTAYLMGHSGGTDMLHSHYKSLVSTANAERFWALTPGTVETEAARAA